MNEILNVFLNIFVLNKSKNNLNLLKNIYILIGDYIYLFLSIWKP